MNNVRSLRHTVWECKYHVVWVPKYRRKVLYGEIRRYLGEVIRDLAAQKECRVEEGHLRSDQCAHVDFDPAEALSSSDGRVHQKGKSAIHIARNYLGRRSNFTEQHFWARGYWVSTVGKDEQTVRESRTRSGRTGVSTSSTFSGNRHL